MVYKKNELDLLIRKYTARLRKKIVVEKVILFGSYTQGRPSKWSDIDLAVISPNLKGLNRVERIALLLKPVYDLDPPMDMETVGYTPEEYKNAEDFDLLREIKKSGKIVYETKPDSKK